MHDPSLCAAAMRSRSANSEWAETQRDRSQKAKAVNQKAVLLRLPDGTDWKFEATGQAAEWLGTTRLSLRRWLTGERPWPGTGKGLSKHLRHLSGLTGRYLTKEEWLGRQ